MSIPDSDNRVWMPSESMKTGRDGVFAVAVCSDKYRAGLRPVVTSECYTPSEVCAVTAGAGLLNVHFQIEGVVTHGTSLVLAANVCHESEGQTFCNSVFVNVPPGNGQNHCGITTGEFDFAKYLRALMVVGSSVTENSIVYEATASGLVHKDTPSKISSTPMVQLVSNPADILWMEGQEVQLVGLSLLHKAVDKDALVENAFANVAVDTTQGRIVFTGASEEHLQEDLIKDGVIQRDDRVAEVINFREGSQASEGVLKVTNSFLGAGPFATQVADGIGPDLNKLMIQHHKKEEGGNFFTAGFKRAHLINPQMPGVLVGQDVETMFAAYYRLLDSGVAAAGEGSVRRLLDSNGGLAISKTLKYVATQDSDLLGKQTVLLRVWVSYTDFCLAADKDRIGKFLDWTADDWADLTVLDADIDPLLKQLACDKRREESEGGRGTVTWRFSAALLGFNKTKGMEYEGVQGLEYPALAGTSFPPTAEEQSDWVMPFGVVMGVVLVAVFVFGVFYVRGGCHKSPPNLREAKNQSNWKPQGKTPPSEVPTNDVGNARGLQSAHQPSDSAV